MRGLKYLAFFCLICLTVIVGVSNIGNYSVQASENENTVKQQPLPTVGSYENLKKILEEAELRVGFGLRQAVGMNGAVLEKAEAPAAAAADFSAQSGLSSDYLQTNVQVQGVDEADTVKTDGEYIYKIANNKLVVAKAYPADELKVISTLTFDQNMYPVEMYQCL